MAERPIVRLLLPLDLGAVGRVLLAVCRDYPDALVGEPESDGNIMVITADPDISLAERRAKKRGRDRAVRERIAALKPGEYIEEPFDG